MLSIGQLSKGSERYYTELAREDYYLNGGEPPGKWWGQGAEALGLSGKVSRDQLSRVMDGFHPGGESEKLVQNAGSLERNVGLDLTFSADKSVSVLWAFGDQETRSSIERAHGEAVKGALEYVQDNCAWTRTGKGGEVLEPCKLTFGTFLHTTSRAQDPNIHTHVIVPNVGVREDGQTSSLWNREFFRHKMAAGAIYRMGLASNLSRAPLGYTIEPFDELGLFRVKDAPRKLCEAFSKRRAAIEAELQSKGRFSAKDASLAALSTREVKGHVARPDLTLRWREEAKELGYEARELETLAKGFTKKARRPKGLGAAWNLDEKDNAPVIDRGKEAKSLKKLLTNTAKGLADERASFRPQDLVLRAACVLQDGETSPEALRKAARELLSSDAVVPIGKKGAGQVFTTPDQLVREDGLLATAVQLDRPHWKGISDKARDRAYGDEKANLSSQERRDAFDYITAGDSQLKLLSGFAGSGKTSLMRAARGAWESEGYRVVGAAISAKAARELNKGAGIDSETVRMRQFQLSDWTLAERLTHTARELYRAAKYGTYKGYKPYELPSLKLDSNTVLVIDECSMLGLRDTSDLLKHAAKAGAKVVMLGDERQLPAIQSVSPFSLLQKQIGAVDLKGIHRQKEEWMKDAVRAAAEGDAATSLSLLSRYGCLKMVEGGLEESRSALVDAWARERGTQMSEKLILTATNDDAKELNRLAQDKLREQGKLGRMGAQLESGETAHRGDRVLFGKNMRSLGVFNGDTGTVKSVHKLPLMTAEIQVELDTGKSVRISLNKYKDVSLGYALTTHKAQGMTVDRTFIHSNPKHAYRELSYVQLSRARERAEVFCSGDNLGEDQAELARSMSRSRAGELARVTEAKQMAEEQAERDRKAAAQSRQMGRERDLGLGRG